MSTNSIRLYNKFYETARKDLNSARILAEAGQFPQSLYYLQQAYEKCVKSLYIYQETRHNNTPEADAYRNVKDQLGHDTQESTITVLRQMAEIENRPFEDQLRNVTDPTLLQYRKALRNGFAGYNRSLDDMVDRLNLRRNFENNIRNYGNFVRARYNDYQNSINGTISRQPDQGFLLKLMAMSLLYPCVYRMNEATRYPLAQFNYDNLDLLSNERQACELIIEMMADLFSLLKAELEFPQTQTNPTARQAVVTS